MRKKGVLRHVARSPADRGYRRFIGWFNDFGIPVGGVVVNGVIRMEEGEEGPEFVRNRIAMQEEYLQQIRQQFDGEVRGVLPLFDDEVRGVPMLRRASEKLFA